MRISDWSSDVCSSDLSLRSIADNRSELEQAIAAGDVTIPDDPAEENKMLLAIASQPLDTRSTFATGADVSRFQRSTVPAQPQDNDNAVHSTAGVPGGATSVAGPHTRDAPRDGQ